MLSILIPTYNYNITSLVNELHRQAMDSYVDFEILVMEDGSTLFLEENKTVSNLRHCNYIVLEKNIGRSAIRNKLADTAQYEYLLFLDCDARIDSKYFINKYLAFCHEKSVVLGGRIYEESIDPKYSLISLYGKMREQNDVQSIEHREKHKVFTSPNFLIPKSIFNLVRFDETIKGYGHEDTVFGLELQKLNIDFKFIDNPVVHIGLEDNETFIRKTENALKNLYTIYLSDKLPTLKKESKILSTFIILKRFRVVFLVNIFHSLFQPVLYKNLKGKQPSLFVFDLYKLGFLCKFSRQK